MIMYSQWGGHPGVTPGFGHDKDWVAPLFGKAFTKAYAATVAALVIVGLAPEAASAARAAGVAGALTSDQLLAETVLASQTRGFFTGFAAGVGWSASGLFGAPPEIPGNTSFNAGAKIGSTAFRLVRFLLSSP